MKRSHLTYMVQTQPGFEAIAADELSEFAGFTLRSTYTVADKNSILLFEYADDPRDLFELRTIEDLFVVVAHIRDLPPTRDALHTLASSVNRTTQIEAALTLARQLDPSRGGRGKLRFRIVARQVGTSAYRRVDAQHAVERGISTRGDHRWQLSEENALEFWLTLLPDTSAGPNHSMALLALRLSDERMRHRSYKIDHLPASLRPTAAAALAWLTQPADDDVFLDPMCGAGTILIERAHQGRYAQLLGGDIRPEALQVALNNVGPRYKPISLRTWDARELPLDAASISAAAVNLPFGKQIGTSTDNRTLYPALLRELARVLQFGARLVALTSDGRNFSESLRRTNSFVRRQSYPVLILGQAATIYVLEKG